MPINTIIAVTAIAALVVFAAWLTWDIHQYEKQCSEDWWYKTSQKGEEASYEPLRVTTKLKGNFIGEYDDHNF
jgi:hypothetical protein